MRGVSVAGVLVAFEGLDQSGKETQARLLGRQLMASGRAIEALEFPDYGSEIGREISESLQGRRKYAPAVLQLLYIANRYEHAGRIGAWLDAGRIVLCDRYVASSIAYGEAEGLDPIWLAETQRHLPQPRLTFLLDIQPETALARKAVGRDRFERDMPLLGRVRASYLRQAEADERWVVLDGEQGIESIAQTVIATIDRRLGLR